MVDTPPAKKRRKPPLEFGLPPVLIDTVMDYVGPKAVKAMSTDQRQRMAVACAEFAGGLAEMIGEDDEGGDVQDTHK